MLFLKGRMCYIFLEKFYSEHGMILSGVLGHVQYDKTTGKLLANLVCYSCDRVTVDGNDCDSL